MGSDGFWIMVIVVTAIWAAVSVVQRIVDGIVQTKKARIELEREYLAEMMVDIEEIKRRLELLTRRERERESTPQG
jgi:hypothetical protein